MRQKLLLTFLTLFASLHHAAAFEYTHEGQILKYDVLNEAAKTCCVASNNEVSGDVIIPSEATYAGSTYSVTSIGDWAFSCCSNLTSITIPNSVTVIGDWAFSYCSDLTSITIPNSVTVIGREAFCDCCGLTSITIPNSVTSISNGAFLNCSGLTSITIPNSVTSIGDDVFCTCSGLTSITIPNSVIKIGDGAFSRCSSLTSITIPSSVTEIGREPFTWCDSLTEISVDAENQCYSSVNGALFNKEKTVIIACPSGLSGDYSIPNSVTTIGNSAFHRCILLKNVNIPNSVTTIGKDAFYECLYLTSVTIPDSVNGIGNYAFTGCSNLKIVTIPGSVTEIGDCAFYRCYPMEVNYNTIEPIRVSAIDVFSKATYGEGVLYVAIGGLEAAKTTEPWCNFKNIREKDFSGIEPVEAENTAAIGYYDLSGRRYAEPCKGVNIVRYSDGTACKISF